MGKLFSILAASSGTAPESVLVNPIGIGLSCFQRDERR